MRFALTVVRSQNVNLRYSLPSNVPVPLIGPTIFPSTLYSLAIIFGLEM
jgi:hypothetical protein